MDYINPTFMTDIRQYLCASIIRKWTVHLFAVGLRLNTTFHKAAFLDPCFFSYIYIYMNDLPEMINNRSVPVLLPMTLVFYSATLILEVLRKILIMYLKL